MARHPSQVHPLEWHDTESGSHAEVDGGFLMLTRQYDGCGNGKIFKGWTLSMLASETDGESADLATFDGVLMLAGAKHVAEAIWNVL